MKKENEKFIKNYLTKNISLSEFTQFIREEKGVVNDLCEYINSVLFWENTHNLISNKSSVLDVCNSVFDSIILSSIVYQKLISNSDSLEPIIDAGAGGGFPGLPLAILFRAQKFYLVDTDRKKCSFLRAVKSILTLDNVTVINKNLSTLEPVMKVITRAAFPPARASILAAVIKKGGRLVIWGTPLTSFDFEKSFKQAGMLLEHREDYQLPDGKKRCLLFFRKF